MNRFFRCLFTSIATVCTTELIFRLSGFRYGVHSVFGQPFDLVSFTVKMLWWFGVWFVFYRLFGRFGGKSFRR